MSTLPYQGLLPIVDTLKALRARLESVKWNGEQAFAAIYEFDIQDLHTALRELCAAHARVALIIYSGEDFDWSVRGQHLHLDRHQREITVLVADRNYGDRQKAFTGDGTKTPGVYTLGHMAINALTGMILPGGLCMPVSGSVAVIQGADRADLEGRGAYITNFHVVGGDYQVDLSKPSITGAPYS